MITHRMLPSISYFTKYHQLKEMDNINFISQEDDNGLHPMVRRVAPEAFPFGAVITQDEDQYMIETSNEDVSYVDLVAGEQDNNNKKQVVSPPPIKRYVQLNFFGETVTETSKKTVKVRAHTRTNKKKGRKRGKDFVPEDDCIETRKLAGKLMFEEAIAYQESRKTKK